MNGNRKVKQKMCLNELARSLLEIDIFENEELAEMAEKASKYEKAIPVVN